VGADGSDAGAGGSDVGEAVRSAADHHQRGVEECGQIAPAEDLIGSELLPGRRDSQADTFRMEALENNAAGFVELQAVQGP
jgi:hypothetical protein